MIDSRPPCSIMAASASEAFNQTLCLFIAFNTESIIKPVGIGNGNKAIASSDEWSIQAEMPLSKLYLN